MSLYSPCDTLHEAMDDDELLAEYDKVLIDSHFQLKTERKLISQAADKCTVESEKFLANS